MHEIKDLKLINTIKAVKEEYEGALRQQHNITLKNLFLHVPDCVLKDL